VRREEEEVGEEEGVEVKVEGAEAKEAVKWRDRGNQRGSPIRTRNGLRTSCLFFCFVI